MDLQKTITEIPGSNGKPRPPIVQGNGFHLEPLFDLAPGAQLIFVGSLACTRHRGFEMGQLMRDKRMSVLCPSATDYASGRYIRLIVSAILEIAEERRADTFILIHGCQCALLATDYGLIGDELAQHRIKLIVHDHCHLCMTEEEMRNIRGTEERP